MVVRHGHVVAEGWWASYSPEAVAAFGELLLREGVWADRQLVPGK